MNQNIEELGTIEFREEIARRLELDFEKDIFDLIDETSNIINEKRKILDLYTNKNIELCELDTTGLQNIKKIKCYYVSTRDKEDYDEYTYIIFDELEKARKYFNEYIDIKTLKEWNESEYNYFNDFCEPGDMVSQDIIDYFINSYPPITYYEEFVQAGEPYSHELDIEDNKYKATYTTFEKKEGHWIYKGNCFKGKKINSNYLNNNFKIVNDFEKYNGLKLLFQPNGSIASLYKGNYLISLEVNGNVIIADKNGNEVSLNDKKLMKSIENNTFDKNYETININWLEFVYYEKTKNGNYEELNYDNDTYSDLEEIGITAEDIRKELNDRLDEYILEEEEDLEEI